MNEEDAIKALNALSQQTRLRIVRFLVRCGDRGAAAGEVADHVASSSSRASFHLAALANAGVISSERQSRNMIYRADLSRIGGLISYLLNDCCGNDPDILAYCIAGCDSDKTKRRC